MRSMLRSKVDLQAENLTRTAAGDATPAWVDLVRNMRASVQPAPDEMVAEFKKLNQRITHVVYCETRQRTPSGLTVNTVPAIVRDGRRHRIVLRRDGQTRRMIVTGTPIDFVEMGRLTRFPVEEKDNAYWNAA